MKRGDTTEQERNYTFQPITEQSSTDLKSTCLPFIYKLESILDKHQHLILLTDETGLILYMNGHRESLMEAQAKGLVQNGYFILDGDQPSAIELCLQSGESQQQVQQTDSTNSFSEWLSSAVPLHNDHREIVGVLSLFEPLKKEKEQGLALISMMAYAIQLNLTGIQLNRKLFEAQHFAFSMMNNLSFGVFAIDLQDRIQWVNDTACRSINTRRKNLINKEVEELFMPWRKVKRIVNAELSFMDEELSFNIPGSSERFLFNAYPIKAESEELLGYILSFRPYSRAFQLANKILSKQTRFSFNDIIAESPQSRQLIQIAAQVAKTPSTLLITGESGTGKEVLAQAIHKASPRSGSAFIAINCGAISESLIESELFGYEEGAFTGARKGGKKGKFEFASGGTLFLDEIGEMPLDMQVKLLRVLQEGKFTKVGGSEIIEADVRIIAATNRNLQEEVKKSRFRLDLYYRLNVINLKIPALRNRKEDLAPLIQHFLIQKAAKFNKPIPEISSEKMEEFKAYPWPGNIRELENAIERLLIIGEFDSGIDEESPLSNSQKTNTVQALWQVEKNCIEKGLESLNGNVSQLAKQLQISRNTLYQKMKKYGIEH